MSKKNHDGERIRSLLSQREIPALDLGRGIGVGKRIYTMLKEPNWTAEMLAKASEVLRIDLLSAYGRVSILLEKPMSGIFIPAEWDMTPTEFREWADRVNEALRKVK